VRLVLGVIIVDVAIFIGMALAEALAGKSSEFGTIRVGGMAGYFVGIFAASVLLFLNGTPLLLRRWRTMIAAETVGFLLGFGGFYAMAVSGGLGFLPGQGDFLIWLLSYTVSVMTGIVIALGWTLTTDSTRVDNIVAQFHDWLKQRDTRCSSAVGNPSVPVETAVRAQKGDRTQPVHQPSSSEQPSRTISFVCGCEKGLRAKEELVGKRVKCPACGQTLIVPQPSRRVSGS